MGANGSHQVDLIRWWCGEIKSVFGQSLTIVKNRLDKHTKEEWTATADDLVTFFSRITRWWISQYFYEWCSKSYFG